MKVPLLIMAAVALNTSIIAADLAISSLDRHGSLTWTNSITNAVYQVQWANSATGSWANFQALANLDSIQSTDTTVTVRVPLFYRVAATGAASNIVSGLYRYRGYDTNGELLIVGWLSLPSTNSRYAGDWVLGYARRTQFDGSDPALGPQIGVGSFSGGIDSSRVNINLNPDKIDDNVSIVGEFNGNVYTGIWYWSTDAAPWVFRKFLLERVSASPLGL